MFPRTSTQTSDGASCGLPVLEREQITLSNVQIDSWLATHPSFGISDREGATMRALRTVLAKYTWRRPEALEFFEGRLGRLYLREDVLGRPLYFSCAAARGVLAILVSREPRVGLELAAGSEAEALLPRIEAEIAAQERDVLAGLSPAARRRALLSIWTRKRALQQANAVHEVANLKSIAVGQGELALDLPASFGWLHQWRLHGFTLRSGEIGSIAVYRHEQLLILGAGDRRGANNRALPGHERRKLATAV